MLLKKADEDVLVLGGYSAEDTRLTVLKPVAVGLKFPKLRHVGVERTACASFMSSVKALLLRS